MSEEMTCTWKGCAVWAEGNGTVEYLDGQFEEYCTEDDYYRLVGKITKNKEQIKGDREPSPVSK